MKAIRIHTNGGPEVLLYEEVADPSPDVDEVVVQVAASGVNFIDIYQRTGLYPIDLPFTAGQEAAGTVAAVGAEVTDFKVGDRVAYAGRLGGYAEYAAVRADRLLAVPSQVDIQTAAALPLQGLTVHYLTHSTFPLGPGHTALVHAAAGGVGLLLIQVAKMLGARVIGTCSTAEKAEKARNAGADHIILYTKEDFETEVGRITDHNGVDVVYDSVGEATWKGSLSCLRPRGMAVFFGNASGPVPAIAPLELSQRGSLFLTRPTLAHYIATRDELVERADALFSWVVSGKLQVEIGTTFPLAEAATAQQKLAGRKTTGKILLIP